MLTPIRRSRLARPARWAVAPLVALTLAAGSLFGAAAPAAAAELAGAPWRLVSYAGPEGSQRPVLPGTEVTATFQDGRVSGSAGCNQYTAGYQLAQDAAGIIRISQAASTQRFCVEPAGVMDQETAYLQALGRVERYAISGDELTLRDAAGGVLLVFAPQPQARLEGTEWVADSFNNGRGGLQSLATGTEITALFQGGRLSGSAGCNTYTTSYTLGGPGGAVTIAPPASTRRICATPPGIMEQEAAYLAALPTTARYRIEGDRLTLEMDDGARVATYTARATRGPAAQTPAGLPRTGAGPRAGGPERAALAAPAILGLLVLAVGSRGRRPAGPPPAGSDS
jgi:heat shock protein HslJ